MSDVEDYDVVINSSIEVLISRVRAAINEGWTPVGGITFSGGKYMQAIVKA